MVEQYRQQLDSLMQREVTRGEFIKFMGIALLGIIGVLGFIKNLREVMPAHQSHKHSAHVGFGRGAYGR